MKIPQREPLTKRKLNRPESDHDHHLEIYETADGIKAVKKDSKPIYNEDIYKYEQLKEGGLEFKEGKHSCSGAGKYRSTTPSDSLDEKIRNLFKTLIKDKD